MDGTVEKPVYRKFQTNPETEATKLFGISCDEGWRERILCTGMYEWAADWLVEQLQGKPYPVPHVGVI